MYEKVKNLPVEKLEILRREFEVTIDGKSNPMT